MAITLILGHHELVDDIAPLLIGAIVSAGTLIFLWLAYRAWRKP